MANTSLQETRDSIGSADQTKDLIFAGQAKERIKVRVVNEVITLSETDGAVFDDLGIGFDNSNKGFDGTIYFSEEWLRRRWEWKTYQDLEKSPTNTGVLVIPGVEINLTL